jgi:hypothetical protein
VYKKCLQKMNRGVKWKFYHWLILLLIASILFYKQNDTDWTVENMRLFLAF